MESNAINDWGTMLIGGFFSLITVWWVFLLGRKPKQSLLKIEDVYTSNAAKLLDILQRRLEIEFQQRLSLETQRDKLDDQNEILKQDVLRLEKEVDRLKQKEAIHYERA